MADKKTGTKKGKAKGTGGGKGKPVSQKKAQKKKASTAGSRGVKPAAKGVGSGNTALYVLVIMILATIVVLLSGNYIKEVPRLWERVKNEVTSNKDKVPEKKDDHNKEIQKAAEDLKKEPEAAKIDDGEPVKREIDAKIYFVRFNDATEKTFLSSVRRRVREDKKVEEALKLLIRGTNGEEKKKGYLTAIPENLRVNDVKIRNRTAEIDFNSAIEYGATGTILVNRIDQIVYTATQFEDIDSVVIKINGRRQKTLGADGIAIDGPLHRNK